MNESGEEKAPARAELTSTHLLRQEAISRSTCQGPRLCPEAQVLGVSPCLGPGCPVPVTGVRLQGLASSHVYRLLLTPPQTLPLCSLPSHLLSRAQNIEFSLTSPWRSRPFPLGRRGSILSGPPSDTWVKHIRE